MVSSQFEAIISPYCIKYLKLIWKMLPEFALEARFTVSEKGIQVEAINPGSAVYVQIDFARDFFRSLSGKTVLSLKLWDKKNRPPSPMLSQRRKCKEVVWSEEGQFYFVYKLVEERQSISFKVIKSIDKIWYPSAVDYSKLKMEVEFLIATKALHEIFEELDSGKCERYFDRIKITTESIRENVRFSACCSHQNEDRIRFRDSWSPQEGEHISFIRAEKACSEYDWLAMYTFLENVRTIFPNMLVTYSTDGPLEMRSRIGCGIDLVSIKAVFCPKLPFRLVTPNLESSEVSTGQLNASSVNS